MDSTENRQESLKTRGALNFGTLIKTIGHVHEQLTARAKRAVNVSLTLRNWLIGYYIDEYQLKGSDRAEYGDRLVEVLSERLLQKEIAGTGKRQLYQYVAFYRAYPQIVRSVTAQLSNDLQMDIDLEEKVRSGTAQFTGTESDRLLSQLSYTHLEQLVRLDEKAKRDFYEIECIRGQWSVRELKRQIASLYYERTALSSDKEALVAQTAHAVESEPLQFPIRMYSSSWV